MLKEKFQFEPDSAINGQQAVEMFKSRNIDGSVSPSCKGKECTRSYYHLVFMDLNMPVMDGFDAAK